MTDVSSNWQDSLSQELVNRLTRPLRQPGMMKMAMSQGIINRCDRFLNRLPLLSQQMQRWGNTSTLSTNAVPIVYAQPVSLTEEQGIQSKEANFQSNTSQNLPSVPIIQRKVDSSQALNLKSSVESAIVPEQQQDLSSANLSEQTTSSLSSENPVVSPQPISSEIPLQATFVDSSTSSANPSPSKQEEKTSINPTSLSASENPVVSPQPVSSEIPLQAKFVESSAPSVNPSPSKQEEKTSLNPTFLSASENPVVSPQPVSSEIPLQAKFIESSTSSVNPSPSKQEEKTSLNPTFPSSSKNLVVSPQPISSEIQLLEEYTNTSQQPLPIIQAKWQDYSLSPSSLPIVNAVNSLASLKQEEKSNYSRNINSSQPEKLAPQNFSTDLPIVTTQPLTSQIDLNEEDISLTANQLNYQNISQQRINKTQSIASLPVVTVTSPINSSLKSQSLPLPLANNSPSSHGTSRQPNSSQQNQIASNNNSSSSPRIITNPSLPTETSVSSMTNQSKAKIDVEAIANKVERKLMRRLVIESERRGKIR